jgi:hypothetical protein
MKLLVSLVLYFTVPYLCKAQAPEEWLEQKKTQKKYLLQQIAALQEYSGYVQKGFDIAQKGLTTISAIKHGDFKMHNVFFSSLRSINPTVGNHSKVEDIVALHLEILAAHQKAKELLKNQVWNADDRSYMRAVFSKLIEECAANVEELMLIISPERFEMKDDERIKQIEKLYDEMSDKCTFARSFLNQIMVIALSRVKEANDISTTRKVYGIKSN